MTTGLKLNQAAFPPSKSRDPELCPLSGTLPSPLPVPALTMLFYAPGVQMGTRFTSWFCSPMDTPESWLHNLITGVYN